MPVSSSSTRIIHWPDREQVKAALRDAAEQVRGVEPRLRAIGYFGSYARGDWGVGSDVDLVVLLETAPGEPTPGALRLDWTREIRLPVAHDLFIYSVDEARTMAAEKGRFARMLESDTVWIVGRWPGETKEGAEQA